MKNTIYFDAEFAPLLLVNEEQVGSNSIVINIEADSTADQSLLITMDSGTTTSLTVTPGQENSLAIDEAYWSLGGSTFVSLVKGGLTSNSITLIFPETINTDAALEETSNLTYTMTGSNTVTEQIDDLDDRVTALEQGGGGNVVYTSVANPDSTLGNEGDLWVKYHIEYDDKFINSDNEEISVNIPRFNNSDDALSYVETNFRPSFDALPSATVSNATKLVKSLEGQASATIYQLNSGRITASQFPQLEVDDYTVNSQSISVLAGEDVGWSNNRISTNVFANAQSDARINLEDLSETIVRPSGNEWEFRLWYIYYDLSTEKISCIILAGEVNVYYGYLVSSSTTKANYTVSIDLADTSFAVIDEVYCKINGKWTLYDGSGSGGTNVEVTQILTSGTEIAQIDLNGDVVSIYAPTPQTISYVQTLASGTNIGTITIDGTATPIYAPPSGSTVAVTTKTSTGTNIADIDVDGTTYQLFAPTGGSSSEVRRSIDWDNKVDITLPYTATADGYFYFRMWQMRCQFTINGVNVISEAEFDSTVSGSRIYPISTGDVIRLDYGTTPGTLWFVPLKETGSSGGGGSASNVTYDNTTSGLTASNVQDAIDEIAQDFQDGCDTISQAVIAKGQTPASNSPADIAYAISQISGGGVNYPRLQEIYCAYTDPNDYTYTVTTAGQYLVMAVPGDNGDGHGNEVTISSTDIVFYNGKLINRSVGMYIVNCVVGDTISIRLSNYAGGSYRGTSACILRNIGKPITGAVEDWYVKKWDASDSKTTTLSPDTLYLCIGMSCGGTHSSTNRINSGTGDFYSSNLKKSDININVISVLSGDVSIYQQQQGQTAGATNIAGYILTV